MINRFKVHLSKIVKLARPVYLAAAIFCTIPGVANAGFKVVGYFPTWQGDVSSIPFDKVTHINYSFVIPTPQGGLLPLDGGGQKLTDLVQRAHSHGVKVLIAVGGWNGGDDSAFRSFAANSTYRNAFITNIENFVNLYQLDGVDIDWEYPDAGSEANNFRVLMKDLGERLHSNGKLLTAAVTATDFPGSVDSVVIDSVDFLNLMVYDLGLPHSTYNAAQIALAHWKNNEGLPKDKAVLGVPFYSHTNWVSYKDIIATYGASAAFQDNAGGLDYNGIPTIKAKSELSLAEAGGIMFWEISQDTQDETSLMSAIWDVVGSSIDFPEWQSGQTYYPGDIVRYNGQLYITVHENPGYDPVISYWFWDLYADDNDDTIDSNIDVSVTLLGDTGKTQISLDGSSYIRYRAAIVNEGSAADVVLTNIFPEGVILRSITTAVGSCSSDGTNCQMGLLGAGQSVEVIIEVTVMDKQKREFSAMVSTVSGVDVNDSNNMDAKPFGGALSILILGLMMLSLRRLGEAWG